MARKKIADLSENGATRLMAALAAQEIRDMFDGKGDIELAKKSLHLLLSIIAGAVPNVPTSKVKELDKPAHNISRDAIALIGEAVNHMDGGTVIVPFWKDWHKRADKLLYKAQQPPVLKTLYAIVNSKYYRSAINDYIYLPSLWC